MADLTRLESARAATKDAPTARIDRVEAILTDAADPLSRRLWRARIRTLAARVAAIVPTSFDDAKDPREASALLIATVPRALARLGTELAASTRALDDLLGLLSRLPDPASRRQAIAEHLARTIADAGARRLDEAALDRHFGADTLVERLAREREAHGALEDLAFQFLAASAPRLSDAPRATREAAGLGAAGLAPALVETLRAGLSTRRWQTAVSAIRATLALSALVAPDPARAAPPEALLEPLLARANDPDEHVAVVHAALLVAPRLPDADRDALLERLARTGLDRHPSDRALVRARAIELTLEAARPIERRARLVSLHQGRDPSEHVRMRLFEAAARHGEPAILRSIARGLGWAFEESPRVRAVALRAALARHHETDSFDVPVWGVFDGEREALVLEVGCDAIAQVVEGHPDDAALGERALDLLRRLRARRDVAASVQEAVSSALERIDAARDPLRAVVAQTLRAALVGVPSGGRLDFDLTSLPSLARTRAADPAWMARVLAELARDGLGLDATPTARGYRLVRGDRFAVRGWRLLHEARVRAPNKRQAFTHTVGRALEGSVRAHPGGMDEVTATTVPGERVTIDAEGGWGRHLPTVDDLLHLPVAHATPVRVASSHGTTTLTPPASAARRAMNRARVAWRYARWAGLRLSSLRGTEPSERRAYARAVREELGVSIEFAPHTLRELGDAATPPHVASALDTTTALGFGTTALGPALDYLRDEAPYLLSPTGNSQPALALFSGGLLGAMMVRSHLARRRIRRARAQIPMTIGGWGTRGKSGTERIKAALFHGLGFQVLVKTTGCEAMFIHSVPGQRPLEVFIYRPYDKATIWEQARLLDLAARLRSEVFLWECMALNPRYVDVLEHEWMQDDITTLTNAFPDHEDIQGPAGQNVAEVISRFIPEGGLCFTSEVNFLPLFREQAHARGTRLVPVRSHEADLLPADLLALFPYQEHPRNIALALGVAEHFGIDRGLATTLMAEHVVPDLGVLKTYPDVRLWGRTLRFMNGMSANERTGCVSNWRRMGLDRLDADAEPGEVVVTVVNNRDDRVARSEVFGRILVEDLAADRHVLIGTNLGGLVGYAEAALARLLPTLEVIPEAPTEGGTPAEMRLARVMQRVRVPAPSVEAVLARLRLYARGARLRVQDAAPVAAALAPWLAEGARGPTGLDEVRAALAGDRALIAALDACLTPDEGPDDAIHPEIWAPASRAEVTAHLLDAAARIVVHARLRAALPPRSALPGPSGAAARDAFHATLRAAYAAIVRASFVVVADPRATGDQIIARAVRAVPPGTRLTIMGIQNIKGTGLDFAYRWVALGRVADALDELGRESPARRARALTELEAAGDPGLLDTGLAVARLSALEAVQRTQQDRDRVRALVTRFEVLFAAKQAAIDASAAPDGVLAAAWRGLRKAVDHVDSVRRARESTQVLDDLVTQRISIACAATVLRALTARQKG